jgi:hypothetical protein
MMKFENLAQVGDRLKAFDFQPMRDDGGAWVKGEVVKRHEFGNKHKETLIPFSCYIVKCEESSHDQYKVGEEVFVPYEIDLLEYEERVKKL